MIINESKVNDINLQHRIKNKPFSVKKLFKAALIVSGIVLISTFTLFTKESIQYSKAIDKSQAHYSSMQDYSKFESAFKAVPYTDEMYQKDLVILKKLYEYKEILGMKEGTQTFTSHFLKMKVYLNNDPNKIDDYLSYFKESKDSIDFYRSGQNAKQRLYLESLSDYNGGYKLLKITNWATMAFPDYIAHNMQTMLKNENFSPDLIFNTSETNKFIAENKKTGDLIKDEKLENFYKNNVSQFDRIYNDMLNGNDKEMREMLAFLNSYITLIVSNKDAGSNYKYEISDSQIVEGFRYMNLMLVENIRNIYTHNGTIDLNDDNTSETSKLNKEYEKNNERYFSQH